MQSQHLVVAVISVPQRSPSAVISTRQTVPGPPSSSTKRAGTSTTSSKPTPKPSPQFRGHVPSSPRTPTVTKLSWNSAPFAPSTIVGTSTDWGPWSRSTFSCASLDAAAVLPLSTRPSTLVVKYASGQYRARRRAVAVAIAVAIIVAAVVAIVVAVVVAAGRGLYRAAKGSKSAFERSQAHHSVTPGAISQYRAWRSARVVG
eukprot:765139-Rhodomonas_salina.1